MLTASDICRGIGKTSTGLRCASYWLEAVGHLTPHHMKVLRPYSISNKIDRYDFSTFADLFPIQARSAKYIHSGIASWNDDPNIPKSRIAAALNRFFKSRGVEVTRNKKAISITFLNPNL